MNKYRISMNEIHCLVEKEIEATNESEAIEKYEEMVANGNVEYYNSDYTDIDIEEIK